ncbi:HEAT repeat domain-containing protein [Arenibacter sp. BSSL-BM3]|uniref:HEAT repeat domain-containing protein n=1 Tax=Arenibacter arenosicollis TaxID=2762274 RepID=A0ABR7QJV7_9FLAO|nr:HEAT repeat domain-containing protein [Arenibacter arenosicollis]MBC8767384.1 HEAT repeat domain-containing protein [Arenibacter arenosicollis]
MRTITTFKTALILSLFGVFAISCDKKPKQPQEPLLVIKEDTTTALSRFKEIRESVPAQVAEGLTLTLWASDSLAPDPVAMSVDDEGNIYLTRTNRQKNSEFDIRGFRHWMTPSIALQSVEDRKNFLHETFATEKSKENEWLKDLNNDNIHDWRDLTVQKEEIWKLEDQNATGYANIATRIVNDFHEEQSDVAGALLVRKNDMFVGIAPDMWRITDEDGDGIMNDKTSISHGYGVHIGFGGHGMSGAIEGPDGRIYWGIGDIGANITTADGTHHKYPNQGVIVRSNPDGSDFEVFAAGVRNTHEFVFDEYGNIITADNDGDHRGESERLVYIVEGSDAGWRSNWQYGKYTDPKNNGYNVWMDEKLFVPRWENQAAYIIPPIMNFHNGPTGMAYNPGTALGKEWKNKFFLVEFVGNPSRSHIWSFDLKPKGASFELNTEQDILSGILPTGIRFAPDGALYIADWMNGWDTKNYGRVWKLDVAANKNDLKAERKETERLMTLDYTDQNVEKLIQFLSYPDMRIRQKAQFELADRDNKGHKAFTAAITQKENQLARVHGIWGIGQFARKNLDRADPLMNLLKDSDPEIVAQAAKTLGDVKYGNAGKEFISLLKHENARVRFFAAQALGRIAEKNAVQPLLTMLEANKDEDLYLRHAAVLALARIGETAPIIALADSKNRSLRIAAVLVLRRLQNEQLALFLKDQDEYIVTEAARAINDDWSIEPALPALASLLKEERFTSEPLLRRSINAALRVGGDKELDLLIDFARRTTVSSTLRGEALAAIGTWASPSVLDRVDGRYRGEINRDAIAVKHKIEKYIPDFLKDRNPDILVAAAKSISALKINGYNAQLATIMKNNTSPEVRSAMLMALGDLNYSNIEEAMRIGMADKDRDVRTVAVGLVTQVDIPKEKLPAIVEPIFKSGSIIEQQKMLSVLGEMPLEKSKDVLSSLIKQGNNKKLSNGVILDLTEAVEATQSKELIAQLGKLKSQGDGLQAYSETLNGGNRRDGYQYFNTNSTGQCVRCHAVGGAGGSVGPALDNIGNILSREQILEALINPSARLSPGYGMVTVTLKDGQTITGILEEETEDELILKTSDAEPMEIALSRIDKRQNMASGMPPMGTIMSKREIRDVVEFLAGMKKE